VRGVAFSLPLDWDGTTAGLPGGWDDAVTRAAQLQRSGGSADAAVALSITVASDAARRGLAVRLVEALRDATGRAGGRALIAPVRPVLKARYPLVELAEFLTWRTPDGASFDPWLRTHLRAGARVLGVAPASMTISGTLEDWRTWVEDPLPGAGSYVVPGGLAPLVVADGMGTYVEPNVWLVHDVERLDAP
jgi:GNAT superfamily N-acetyltransferase